MWLLLAFCGPVCWAVSTHIDKYLVDRYFHDSDTAVLMLFTAFLGVALLPLIWWIEPALLKPSLTAIAVMTASGVLYMGAILFYLRAIQSEEASVVAPLFQASTLFTFLLGYLFLHERLAIAQLLGVGLIICGALSLSFRRGPKAKKFKSSLIALMLGLAPRRTATSPAITPPAPTRIAIHRATDAASADRCADCKPQGGPRRGRTSRGEFQPFRSTDAAIITRIETVIPAAASQVSRRTRSADADLKAGRR